MQLHELKAPPRSKRKRVGRGGTRGTTAGRGSKGQRARSGGKGQRRGFEGGRTSLIEQLPKVRGMGYARIRPHFAAVNLADLEQFEEDASVGPPEFRAARILTRKKRFVKVLGNGTLSKKLTVSAHAYSASAKEKIEKAGGSAVLLPLPVRKGAVKKEERSSATR